ncbi:MAG: GNAT family N-acetyltransferase [Anaerolineae bacterium]|nr:GNAT family N-acetyltransferase [Anaerolineae bacterium]
MTEKFDIVEATEQPLDDFILLLEQVGEWLWQKGIKQWVPGTFQKNRARLEHFIENGCLILAYQTRELAGGCILSAVNPGWPKPSHEAMYLNSLVVARFAAGQGLGTKIINVCAEVTRQRGKNLIRLDCWDGNSFLKSYYQGEGFKMLETIPENDYFVRLFEKDVSISS